MVRISSQNLASNIRGKMLEILNYKITELEEKKKTIPLSLLKQKMAKQSFTKHDFAAALTTEPGIGLVAEIKRASPSNNQINLDADILKQAGIYEKTGANAISVLTDKHFFKGSLEFLKKIRQRVNLPLLRKDFIFDEYQIYEAKLFGADAILLISTILTLNKLRTLMALSKKLGLDCLVEVHTKKDLTRVLKTNAKIIGINARNLSTFEIDLQNIINLIPLVPKDKILVAESGIQNVYNVTMLKNAGIKNILVGTALMQTPYVSKKIKELKLL